MNLRKHLTDLISKGFWYWAKVIILILIGVYAGEWLTEKEYWIDYRYKMYQTLQNQLPRKPFPQRTVLVLIDDDEYWKGEPGGRVPIKRDYLSKLLQVVDSANPAVIALDFDLRSPSPDGKPVEVPAYKDETQKLLETIKLVSLKRKIVLPKTIGFDDEENYVLESDIYDGYQFDGGNVLVGYIALPPDARQVPLLTLQVKNGPPLDSFSQAIVRADNDIALRKHQQEDTLPYGGYMGINEFTTVLANQVLSQNTEEIKKLAHKIVILGGNWHDRGYNRGTQIDTYESPIGAVPGAFIHANYVEALIDSRIYRPWKGWVLKIIEAIQSILIAIPFALNTRVLVKAFSLLVVCSLLVVFSLFSLMALGLFFDFFVPVVLVFGHGVIEQVREWRENAGHHILAS
jgi:CHASE2 domain-containing sensor protein